MSPRQLTRIALHLLLTIALVIPGMAAPAQAIGDALQVAVEVSMTDTMGGNPTPCDSMDMSMPDDGAASDNNDCCSPQACDLSACLGTACLPELPRITASVPPAAESFPWRQPMLSPGVIETPLRPPIA